MNKAYSRIRWENLPSIATPLNESNLNRMDVALNEVDDRVISLETTKLPMTTANTMVKDVSFNESTGVFTITKLNGSQVTINTALEKVATNFRFDYPSQKLILTLVDGTTQEIDLSALLTQYEFLESDTITFTIDANGKVTAIVKEGSIEEKHLQPNYLADIKVEVAKAEAGSSDAKNYADLSRKYAIGTDEITWTKSTDITGNSTHITGVAFDGFKFVAINPDVFQSDNSSQTTYLYSLDGKSWEQKSWSYGYMLDIAYGNGNYVAVGGKGEVFYSSDGITWERSSAGTSDLISVAYSPNNKAFVAIEYQTGKMYISENKGVTWSQCASYPSESFNDIVYGATSSSTGKFVAVGDNSIYWSNNGYGWTSSSGYSGHFYVVTYGDGKFVALGNGNAYYSENGISWSAGNGIDGMIYDVTYGNGMFVAIGLTGATYTSLDGIDWKMKYSADSTFSKLTYGNGVFVGVNGSENIYYFDTSILNYSSKGYYERTKNVASTINDFIDMASEHEKNAKNSADLALIYSEDANQSASNANYHSINASNSATNASISATNANNSATNASNSATSANQSADNAKTSEQLAYQYAEEAKESASQTAKNDAVNITYDNATSGLASNNVQGAIDELKETSGEVNICSEVSGKNPTLQDSASAPIISQTVKGYTKQDGTPTPDAPIEIEGLDKVSVKTCGKNIFGGLALENKIVGVVSGATKNEDTGSVQFSGSAITGHILFDSFKANTQYTFIFYGKNLGSLKSLNMCVYYSDGTKELMLFPETDYSNFVFTSEAGKTVKSLRGIHQDSVTILYPEKCGVFEGVITVDDFEPYTETLAEIDLTEPLYEGDYIEYRADGTGVLHRKMEKVVFDGSDDEGWKVGTSTSGNSYAFLTLSDAKTNNYSAIFSTNYKATGSASDTYGSICVNTTGSLIVRDYRFSTADEYKAWLQSNPVTVVYELETPQEIELTAEQVAEFKKLYTFEPVTNVLCDGEVEMRYYKANVNGETVCMLQNIANNSVSKSNSLENRLSKSLVSTETINIDSLSLPSGGYSTMTSDEISKSGYTLVGAKFFLRGSYAENIIASFTIGGSNTKIYNFAFYNPSDYDISAYGYVDLIYVANSL